MSSTPLLIGIAITGSLVLGTTTTGLLAINKHNRFTDSGLSDSARDKAQKSGKRYQLITDGLLVASLAAAAGTAYYYFAVYRPKKRRLEAEPGVNASNSAQSVLMIAPLVGDEAGGMAVVGSF